MKVEELRVGVYVNLKDKGVYRIESGHDIETIDYCWNGTDYCEAILLTEEWLIKFGFKKIEGEWHYHKNLSALNVFARSCSMRWYFEIGGIYIGEITHVHRLQNIWHSLSNGQELTIQP